MRSLLVLLLAAASPAFADDALRAHCLEMLSAYEDPAGEAEWRALGTGAGAELLAIAKDSSLSHTKRANAVVALGWFPSDASRTYLNTLAGTDGESLFRRKAVYALGNGWGDAAVSDIARALAAPDGQLRAAAARSLGKVGTPAAKDALRARLTVESDGMVRDAISSSLGGN